MATQRRPIVGAVIQLALPNGSYAYGRVLRDAAVAFYRETTSKPAQPPVGRRNYQFVVGVHDNLFKSQRCTVVGQDIANDPDDDWPPPMSVQDPITGKARVYHKGTLRPLAPDEDAAGLEPAAVWEYEHLVDRLLKGSGSHS